MQRSARIYLYTSALQSPDGETLALPLTKDFALKDFL